MTTKETWKPVAIGGFTGILMGAGAMYASNYVNSDEMASGNKDDQLKEATVDDGLSFRQAFETARTEVGPGGVFRWHGNIYNTYTAEEWNVMSNQDRELFAQHVRPEVSPADIDARQVAEGTPSDQETGEDVKIAANQDTTPHHEIEQGDSQRDQADNGSQTTDDDQDVHVVGFGHVEVAEGRYVAVEEVDINGQRVAIIDVDNDGIGDIAASDLNHDGKADEGEIIDLHTGESIAFTNEQTDPIDVEGEMAQDDGQALDDGSDMLNITV